MQKNQIITAIIVFAVFLLVVFLVQRNQKDKKALIKKLDNDYKQPKANEPKS